MCARPRCAEPEAWSWVDGPASGKLADPTEKFADPTARGLGLGHCNPMVRGPWPSPHGHICLRALRLACMPPLVAQLARGTRGGPCEIKRRTPGSGVRAVMCTARSHSRSHSPFSRCARAPCGVGGGQARGSNTRHWTPRPLRRGGLTWRPSVSRSQPAIRRSARPFH